MKKTIFGILKVLVPIALGVWLVFYFYNQLDEKQRGELFTAFGQANLWWLVACVILGWCSHMSRAWRWRYLLEPMGHKVGFWNSYHSVMIGYFMNLFLPRAGEASRAATLYRAEKVPFEQGFGTILAERAVDVLMLLAIAGFTLLLQLDKLDLFQARVASFRAAQAPGEQSNFPWVWVIGGAVMVGLMAGAYLIFTRPALRARFMDMVRGFGQGLQAVFRTKNKGAFILHTVLIWACYVGMFQLGFLAVPGMDAVPFAGILAGFVAGTIGIGLVQGGIGVYPQFVAIIISVYLAAPAGGGLIRPDALALGWLLWVAQTLMMIVLGGLSLLLMALKRTPAA